MQFNGSGVVCLSGFDGCGKTPEINSLTIETDKGNPPRVFLVPANTAISARIISVFSCAVHGVLRVGRLPHILFPAIEPVTVDVVNEIGRETKNEAVETNGHPFFATALRNICSRIKYLRYFWLKNAPLKAANNVLIFIVDQCELALGQRYRNNLPILANFTEMETNPPGIKIDGKEAFR